MSLRSIVPGMNESEVRQAAGAPTEAARRADGSGLWWYIQGPQGFTTWRVEFGRDARVRVAMQVLTEANFSRIVPGTATRDKVLDMLGRPRGRANYPNLGEEVLTWRYQDGTFNKYLNVHFGTDGVVLRCVLEMEQTDP